MAKQSFVTGQVLTAQQVNDLQTNDFNQTVSAKTASYTLVAVDKGTRITMSSTSATTITVNDSLFAAGDTLFIQNLNTGVSTITAGTATVTTASSLALAQWEGGTLYFTSASAAIFIKGAGAAAASGSLTLLSTTSLTGSATTISSISQSYKNLLVIINGVYLASDDKAIQMTFNATATGHNYARFGVAAGSFNTGGNEVNAGSVEIGRAGSNSSSNYAMTSILQIVRYTETGIKTFSSNYYYRPNTGGNGGGTTNGTFTAASGISSIKFEAEAVNFSAGTVYIYGVN
jgi:hypothetical protein